MTISAGFCSLDWLRMVIKFTTFAQVLSSSGVSSFLPLRRFLSFSRASKISCFRVLSSPDTSTSCAKNHDLQMMYLMAKTCVFFLDLGNLLVQLVDDSLEPSNSDF